MQTRCLGWCVVLLATLTVAAAAQDDTSADDDMAARHAAFQELMSGVKLVGKFTIVGADNDELTDEVYEITSVRKLPQGDKWLFQARIKYGSTDVNVPLPLDVVFAGDTPVITLTELNIPLMGTFSARIVVYNGKYAGTWTHHGKGGGHLFGVLEREDEETSDDEGEG